MAQKQLEQAHALLKEEKTRTEVLLQRQSSLIECLGWLGELARSTGRDARAVELIDCFRKRMHSQSLDENKSDVEIIGQLGEGSVSWNPPRGQIRSQSFTITAFN